MQYMSGKIYDIKLLDDSNNVVAHFDMSTKTVDDHLAMGIMRLYMVGNEVT